MKYFTILLLFVLPVGMLRADIALPPATDYCYEFEAGKNISKQYYFYYQESVYPVRPLETGESHCLEGVKPEPGNWEKEVKDPEHTLKVWAKNKITGTITDTLFFYSYYNEGDFNNHQLKKTVLLKKISGNKIIYKYKKIKKENSWMPVAALPHGNNKLLILMLMAITGLSSLAVMYRYRLRQS